MEETNNCPCCERHCPKDALQCGRGKRYFASDSDTQSDHKSHAHHHEGKHHHEQHLDTEEKLRMMMRRCGHILWHRSGGKASQERVLRLLAKKEMTQKELLETLEIKPGSLSELLGKMEQSQLVIRTQNVQDKRGVDVCLSEIGKEMALAQKDERQLQSKELFQCLDDDEKVALSMILEKLLHSWKSQFPDTHHHKEK